MALREMMFATDPNPYIACVACATRACKVDHGAIAAPYNPPSYVRGERCELKYNGCTGN